ncbi:MAG: PBP1A family penicillin-binding protein [Thermoleophilia bacterium]|nr:PBP1A family penicillin-binding protein [Thermoleophilia bacterium]
MIRTRRLVVAIAVLVGVPLIGIAVFLTLFLAGLHAVAVVQQDLPSLEAQGEVKLAETTQIYAADGTLLAYLHGEQNRTVISGKQIPDILRWAIVAIEDERFFSHNGVDLEGLARAFVANVKAQKISQGFSTITMQLVGNLYLDRSDLSFTRKWNEIALAWQMERKYSKKEILDMYLNTVYFGSNAYGVEAAARTYFNKDPADLTIAEAALLAGLPQAPSIYSPRRHPEAALKRRNLVLAKMFELGYITRDEYQQALAEPLNLAPYSPYTKVEEPYVVAYVRKQLIDMFGEERVFAGGLRVETTIDPEFQKLAVEAITSTLDQPDDPSAALVSIEVGTGYIRAMVGGKDYDSSKFNLAVQGKRQPGSAFKTFCLVAALEKGMDPYNTYYESMPVSLTYPGAPEPWQVKTYGNTYYGTSSVYEATLRSDNTVYAQMALDVGAETIVDVAHRMGITSELNPDPAIALGGLRIGVSPLEMAAAYATLANKGEYVEPTIILRVKDTSGRVLYEAKPKRRQAISAAVAYEVTKILAMNIKRGTGTKADIDRPAAGKTGTTTEWHDAWFCGYTPHLSTTVWVGHPEAQISMKNVHGIRVTGGSFPAIIWQKFMYVADRKYPEEDFEEPQIKIKYDPFFQSTYRVAPTSTTISTTTTTETTTVPETIPETTVPSEPPVWPTTVVTTAPGVTEF